MPVQALDVESGPDDATALLPLVAFDEESAPAAPEPVAAPASSTTTVSPARRPRRSA